jgi:hypothetical protein
MASSEHLDQVVALSKLWAWYSANVYGDYSRLNSALADAAAVDPSLLRRLLECPPHAHDPNMLLAAVHYLVLAGSDHPLSAVYRSGELPHDIESVFRDFCLFHWDELASLLTHRRIQTNECGRCTALIFGVSAAATCLGDPVALVDAGASAGLNLYLDEYLLDFGPLGTIGPASSPVRIRSEVRGPVRRVPARLPAIAARAGIDRDPVDITDPDNVRWLLACVWPWTGRHERTAAAIEMVAARPSLVRAGDMVTDLAPVIDSLGNLPTVVVTSWAYSYLTPDQRNDFEAQLTAAACTRPVAWVCADGLHVAERFDPPGAPPAGELTPSVLGLAVFDASGGVDARALAYVQPHGRWVEPITGC